MDESGPALRARPQEGDDRPARRPQRVPGRRGARAERGAGRARVGGRGRQRRVATSACTRCSCVGPGRRSRRRSYAAANAALADHQRIRTAVGVARRASAADRGHAQAEARGDQALGPGRARRGTVAAPVEDPVEALLARLSHGRSVDASTSLEELGLSSLDRVELMVALEQRLQTSVRRVRVRVGQDRRRPARAGRERSAAADERAGRHPRSSRHGASRWPARAVRRVLQVWLVLPLTRHFARITCGGAEHLRGLTGPVVLRLQPSEPHGHAGDPGGTASGTSVGAWPRRWPRSSSGPISSRPDYSLAGARRKASSLYFLAALAFNAFPLPQREAGARDTLRYIGRLTSAGFSILIFPEGARGESGSLKPFRPGVAHDWQPAQPACHPCPARRSGPGPPHLLADGQARSGSKCGSGRR